MTHTPPRHPGDETAGPLRDTASAAAPAAEDVRADWRCEACGAAVAQPEGTTTAAAVRDHARAERHAPASVRRVLASGAEQRWRTEEDRARDAERRAREAEPVPHAQAPATEPRPMRPQESPPRPEKRKNSARAPWSGPLAPEKGSLYPLFAVVGLGAIVLGFLLYLVGGEAGWCYRHPDDGGHHVHASQGCSTILRSSSWIEVFAGAAAVWVFLAGIASLMVAVLLLVAREASSPKWNAGRTSGR
ncbi:hypothetical protein ACWIGE_14985 [Streptomyces diastaticus]